MHFQKGVLNKGVSSLQGFFQLKRRKQGIKGVAEVGPPHDGIWALGVFRVMGKQYLRGWWPTPISNNPSRHGMQHAQAPDLYTCWLLEYGQNRDGYWNSETKYPPRMYKQVFAFEFTQLVLLMPLLPQAQG